ncbi:antitoxin Xre/MbcA/ParS toxin-binding domain-containing protein [Vibrio mediterranei]|uniref:antitoxin Xre/MbcA/ParS toxin-binding domain-containing protein n=1 Tax=Vibrio mediterranei TaxID=689 RepID=UPI004069054E
MNKSSVHKLVVELGLQVFSSKEQLEEWLQTRLPVLDGLTPIEMLEKEGGKGRVVHVLSAMMYGDFS